MLKSLYRFYAEVIFPWGMDKSMSTEVHTKARQETLKTAEGKVLEIGFGTGLNLPNYPSLVEKIWTADPNPGHSKKALARIEESPISVEYKQLQGESLPFENNFFDVTVSTWTLCSIQDLPKAMSEIHRVLKPDGKLLFMEHGLSPDPKVAKWQHRLNGWQKIYADGCQLNISIKDAIQNNRFEIEKVEEYYQQNLKKHVGYTYRGIAAPMAT